MKPLRFVVFLALTAPQTALAEDTAPTAPAGREIFLDLCGSCHGEDATAGASGDIRGLSHPTLIRALNGIEQMPSFDFTDAEIEALAQWLGIAAAN